MSRINNEKNIAFFFFSDLAKSLPYLLTAMIISWKIRPEGSQGIEPQSQKLLPEHYTIFSHKVLGKLIFYVIQLKSNLFNYFIDIRFYIYFVAKKPVTAEE